VKGGRDVAQENRDLVFRMLLHQGVQDGASYVAGCAGPVFLLVVVSWPCQLNGSCTGRFWEPSRLILRP
jgi:hypothetical protein